jgi:hypothetical protein
MDVNSDTLAAAQSPQVVAMPTLARRVDYGTPVNLGQNFCTRRFSPRKSAGLFSPNYPNHQVNSVRTKATRTNPQIFAIFVRTPVFSRTIFVRTKRDLRAHNTIFVRTDAPRSSSGRKAILEVQSRRMERPESLFPTFKDRLSEIREESSRPGVKSGRKLPRNILNQLKSGLPSSPRGGFQARFEIVRQPLLAENSMFRPNSPRVGHSTRK